MLIRFLFVQRNSLDLCYFLAFFNNRYRNLKLNILNPISIFPSFREYINAFNKFTPLYCGKIKVGFFCSMAITGAYLDIP